MRAPTMITIALLAFAMLAAGLPTGSPNCDASSVGQHGTAANNPLQPMALYAGDANNNRTTVRAGETILISILGGQGAQVRGFQLYAVNGLQGQVDSLQRVGNFDDSQNHREVTQEPAGGGAPAPCVAGRKTTITNTNGATKNLPLTFSWTATSDMTDGVTFYASATVPPAATNYYLLSPLRLARDNTPLPDDGTGTGTGSETGTPQNGNNNADVNQGASPQLFGMDAMTVYILAGVGGLLLIALVVSFSGCGRTRQNVAFAPAPAMAYAPAAPAAYYSQPAAGYY
eukprot:PLAT5739.1.p1 GENE.PLAT5739.1~~PLAT5739.1.p1  ORF type:complete len:311 (+),score=131.27 PLAT5739.1:76-933(+)